MMVRWAMGDANSAVLFIKHCLDMDEILNVRAHIIIIINGMI